MMLFRLDTEAVIINEVVINEVRLRECLWNPRNLYYKNKLEKYKAWEEVSVAVLPKYTTYSEDNKRRIVRAVQSRWKTARDAYMKCRLTEIKKPTYKARQHRFIFNKLRFLERARDVFEDIDEDGNDRVKVPTHSAGGNTAGIAGLAAGQAKVRPAFITKESLKKGVPLGKIRQSLLPALCVAFKGPTHSAGGNATSTAAGQVAVRPVCHTKELPNKGGPLGKSGMYVVFKEEEGSNSFVGDNSENQSLAFKAPKDSAGGNAAGQAAMRPACHTKEPPNKGVPLGKSGMRLIFKEEEGSNSFVDDYSESQSMAFKGPTHSANGNAVGTAAMQDATRPSCHRKQPPNIGVPLGKSGMRVIFKDEEGSNSFVGDNSERQSIALKGLTHSAGANAAVQDAMRPVCHTKEPPNKEVPVGKSGVRVVFKDEEGNSFVGDNSESQSIAFKVPTHSAGGNVTGTAAVQDAVRPACHTKEPPNKGVPLGKSRICVVSKDNVEGSNSFVDDNSQSQSTSTVCDDDMNEGSDEMMDFDIDIHDDFKENIKHLVTAFDGSDDKAVNDNIKQEYLPGTSSQNNYQKVTVNVTKPPKNSTSAKSSSLESDDLLFFNSLAPLINNFDIYQKLMLRSKIMEVVNEVGKIGPVKIKQERET